MFVERKIIGRKMGKLEEDFRAIGGWTQLKEECQRLESEGNADHTKRWLFIYFLILLIQFSSVKSYRLPSERKNGKIGSYRMSVKLSAFSRQYEIRNNF